MKTTFLSLMALAITLTSFGQAPEAFKYQAVVRDGGGLILTNQTVGYQLTILQGSPSGTAVYTERFTLTTNGYGLVNLEIGTGTTTDDFTIIDWANGPYFMETAVDLSGGTSYTVMGTSQLMSVPYALYAKTSGNGAGPVGPAGNDGVDGIDGQDGATGPAGPQGIQGVPGNDGVDGIDGLPGATGPAGPQGIQGVPGNDGAVGATGPAGPQGIQGIPGNDGAVGATGPAGPQGPAGNDGVDGIDGQDGATGPAGPAGADGQGGVTQAGTNVTITGAGTGLDPYVVNATDNVDDLDNDPTNEIELPSGGQEGQILTIIGGVPAWVVTLAGGGNTLDEAYDQGGPGLGSVITVDAGEVELINGVANGIGLRASTTNTGVGILATSLSAANAFSPIQASTNATSGLTSAIVGSTTGGASGVSGQVESTATAAQGVYGNNLRTTGGYGTYGIGHSGTVGETNYQLGFGLYGRNYDAIGPIGNAVGTYGMGYIGVWGDQTDPLGYSVYANGDFGAAGTKAFSIDHPLDPENKYLRHYSIESNEVLNMYRGTVPFDANGEVVVTMPDYFDAVNANFSYQLTPIGGYAPLFIKEKLNNRQFVIAGGSAGMEVSWTVYAERNDPYMQQHPESKQVEVNKEEWNQGKYLQPDLYNQPDSKKIVKPLETGEVSPERGIKQKKIELIEK